MTVQSAVESTSVEQSLRMLSVIGLVCMLGLLAASPAHGAGVAPAGEGDDNPCVGWDDNIDGFIFETAREDIKKAGKDRLPLKDVDRSVWWHTGVTTKNGAVGDLTSFALLHFRDKNQASLLCQTQNDTHSNITLAMDIGFSNLAVSFDNVLIKLPILPDVGDTGTKIVNSGNAVSLSLSVLTTPTSKCLVNLNYFQIHDLGTFKVEFDHGAWNTIVRCFINISFRLVKWVLTITGVLGQLENQVTELAFQLASQDGPAVCQVINNIFGTQ